MLMLSNDTFKKVLLKILILKKLWYYNILASSILTFYRCFSVSAFQHFSVSPFQRFSVSAFKRFSVSALKHFSVSGL